MIVNGIELCPGMILIGIKNSKKATVIVIPIQNGLGFVNLNNGEWSTNYQSFISDLWRIRGLAKTGFIDSGDVLWAKEVKLTISEIAKKFDISEGTRICIGGILYEN